MAFDDLDQGHGHPRHCLIAPEIVGAWRVDARGIRGVVFFSTGMGRENHADLQDSLKTGEGTKSDDVPD